MDTSSITSDFLKQKVTQQKKVSVSIITLFEGNFIYRLARQDYFIGENQFQAKFSFLTYKYEFYYGLQG